MTPDDRELLQRVGFALLENFKHIIIGPAFLYGIFSPLAIITLHELFIRRGLSSQGTKTILGVILFGLLAAAGNVTAALTSIFAAMRLILVENAKMPLAERTVLADAIVNPSYSALEWFSQLPVVVNDALIIWRAWVIFSKTRWALYILIPTWIATAGPMPINPNMAAIIASNIAFTSQCLSLATNFLATSFIGSILWSVNSQISDDWVQDVFHSKLVSVATARIATADSEGIDIFNSIYAMISAMYPTITTFLIHGPFSMVGIHDTVTEIYESGSTQDV
ncbi:hypothetical protein H0H92_004158 [Tricholoma furcatifolium]|nr:hypothetical protein H0H92_004158 [Tricholoma furcatifolium]